jgi:diacylglycerol kinase family enzyme
MRVALIIKPISGGRRRVAAINRQHVARAWFAARSIHADIEVTTHHGHAIELARAFVRDGTSCARRTCPLIPRRPTAGSTLS